MGVFQGAPGGREGVEGGAVQRGRRRELQPRSTLTSGHHRGPGTQVPGHQTTGTQL